MLFIPQIPLRFCFFVMFSSCPSSSSIFSPCPIVLFLLALLVSLFIVSPCPLPYLLSRPSLYSLSVVFYSLSSPLPFLYCPSLALALLLLSLMPVVLVLSLLPNVLFLLFFSNCLSLCHCPLPFVSPSLVSPGLVSLFYCLSLSLALSIIPHVPLFSFCSVYLTFFLFSFQSLAFPLLSLHAHCPPSIVSPARCPYIVTITPCSLSVVCRCNCPFSFFLPAPCPMSYPSRPFGFFL